MSSESDDENKPKKKLEPDRGGTGRGGKTRVGAGEGGDFSEQGPSFHSGNRPRVIVCERNALLREGAKAMLHSVVSIIGEASNGMEAVELMRRYGKELDVAILDVDLDVLNGLEVAKRVELRNVAILCYTDSYHATKYMRQLMEAGVRGVCLKSSGPGVLLETFSHVSSGGIHIEHKILELVYPKMPAVMKNFGLNESEVNVLIRLDLRNREIAEELNMKPRTVEKHVECVLAKLKAPTRTAAALKAVQYGYVLLPIMPPRDPATGITFEQIEAELHARSAIERWRKSD